jgi:hypothetical protein
MIDMDSIFHKRLHLEQLLPTGGAQLEGLKSEGVRLSTTDHPRQLEQLEHLPTSTVRDHPLQLLLHSKPKSIEFNFIVRPFNHFSPEMLSSPLDEPWYSTYQPSTRGYQEHA